MAREFAKKFYKSRAWKRARLAYIAEVCGLCERCNRPCGTSGIVHHREHLNEGNIHDPDITLNKTNLEYLCIFCHNAEHMGAKVLEDGLFFGADGDLHPRG